MASTRSSPRTSQIGSLQRGWASGSRSVVVRWTVRGVHQGPLWGFPETGEPLAIEGVNVFRVRDGMIVERLTFLDPAGLLGLVGV